MKDNTPFSNWCCAHLSNGENNVTIGSIATTVLMWSCVYAVCGYFMFVLGCSVRVAYTVLILCESLESVETIGCIPIDILIGAVATLGLGLSIFSIKKMFAYKIICCKRDESDDGYE